MRGLAASAHSRPSCRERGGDERAVWVRDFRSVRREVVDERMERAVRMEPFQVVRVVLRVVVERVIAWRDWRIVSGGGVDDQNILS